MYSFLARTHARVAGGRNPWLAPRGRFMTINARSCLDSYVPVLLTKIDLHMFKREVVFIFYLIY